MEVLSSGKMLLLLSFAGAAGTLLRYGAVRLAAHCIPGILPWGTLGVNVMGALGAGMCWVLCRKFLPQYEAFFPVLFVGFFGAFTTFSTFALESARFLNAAEYGKFWIYAGMQNVTGLAAAWGGMVFAEWFVRHCFGG